MLLRNKQKPDGDEHLIPHLRSWHGSARKQDGPAKNGTARFAEFSKLSARAEKPLRFAPVFAPFVSPYFTVSLSGLERQSGDAGLAGAEPPADIEKQELAARRCLR